MGKLPKFAYLGILAFVMAGCGTGGDETATPPTPTPKQPVAQQPATTTPQGFPGQLVTPSPAATVPITTADLIKPTDGNERAAVVRKGRTDPFARVPGQLFTTQPLPGGAGRTVPTVPPVQPANRTPVQQGNQNVGGTPGTRPGTTITIPGRPGTVAIGRTTPGRNIRPGTPAPKIITIRPNQKRVALRPTPRKPLAKPKVAQQPKPKVTQQAKAPVRRLPQVQPNQLPQVIPNPGLVPLAPPPPQPDLARAVAVKGVLQTGSDVQAIVKMPDEPTTRSVRAGQRLANGILVKRIEVNEGSDPVVVLEQYGIEVAKAVGEAPANPAQPGQNTISVAPPNQNPLTPGA